jgi:hypothetical protein
MDWNAMTGPKSFLIIPFMTGLPMWFALLHHRADLFMWLISPFIGLLLCAVSMLLMAGLQPLLVRFARVPEVGNESALMFLVICVVVGYAGGFVAARMNADEEAQERELEDAQGD